MAPRGSGKQVQIFKNIQPLRSWCSPLSLETVFSKGVALAKETLPRKKQTYTVSHPALPAGGGGGSGGAEVREEGEGGRKEKPVADAAGQREMPRRK